MLIFSDSHCNRAFGIEIPEIPELLHQISIKGFQFFFREIPWKQGKK
tara:strand:- start:1709 stop:1849 length:141 start_codon:yes stop_codon:yes gene_type:complete